MRFLSHASRPVVAGQLKLPSAAPGVRRPAVHCPASAISAASLASSVEDKWIVKNVVPLLPSSSSVPQVAELRSSCQSALSSMRMPSTRNEEYRFTDISPVFNGGLALAPSGVPVDQHLLDQLEFPEAAGSSIVVIDGIYRPELSNTSALPSEVYIGGSAGAPPEVLQQLGAQSNVRGGPFAIINGSLAQDVLVIAIPADTSLQQPLYLLHISSSTAAAADTSNANGGGAKLSISAPRLLISLAAGSNVEVVEEYVSATVDGAHVSLPVAEVALGKNAVLKHGYVNREAQGASHFRATLVTQAEGSSYELVEARVGGSLTRHDLGINQDGPDTITTLKHFLLAGAGQLQDLHSKLRLDHPRGQANQLHKCIASAATGRGVFDGNVKVNRFAQKTDAGQLSRNLLLVPKATVNVKPNLQIIADDVKCTHGCAVSDLSQEELFYFRARGVSYEQARQALVFSFGAEVVQELKYEKLVSRIQQDVVDGLEKAVQEM